MLGGDHFEATRKGTVARGNRGSERHRPDLPLAQARCPLWRKHRTQIEREIPSVLGNGIANLFESHRFSALQLLVTGPAHATLSVSCPDFQLQGQSSSVCSASSTRSTSSGLRPTLRSVT